MLLYTTSPTCLIIGLSKSSFKTLLELSVTNSFFIFNGKLFRQIKGLGMGLPLGPAFANIFMSFMESKWLDEFSPDFKPVLHNIC